MFMCVSRKPHKHSSAAAAIGCAFLGNIGVARERAITTINQSHTEEKRPNQKRIVVGTGR